MAEDTKSKTVVDIWNEVKEEEEVEAEAFEFLASQVGIDNFHQKVSNIKSTKIRHSKKIPVRKSSF